MKEQCLTLNLIFCLIFNTQSSAGSQQPYKRDVSRGGRRGGPRGGGGHPRDTRRDYDQRKVSGNPKTGGLMFPVWTKTLAALMMLSCDHILPRA